MKSPFPGMDPYLESQWQDVHSSLVTYIRDALQPQLPGDLRARSESQVLVEAEEAETSQRYDPDVHVSEVPFDSERGVATTTGSLLATPVTIRRLPSPAKHKWVQIIDVAKGNRVVTVVEILSPANKAPGKGNADYLRKLKDYEAAEVSVVEIDLIRYPGRGRMEYDTVDLPVGKREPYLVGVRQGWDASAWRVYPMPLREPLKAVPIPLRKPDREIVLDLQQALDRAYVNGGHDDIDYSKPLDPPLSPEDAAWAAALIAGRIRK